MGSLAAKRAGHVASSGQGFEMIPQLWQFFYWLWVGSEVVIGVGTRTKRRSGNVQDRGSLALLWIVIFSSMTAAIWHSQVSQPGMFGGRHGLQAIGLGVLIVALLI